MDLVRQGNPDAVRIVTAAGRALGDVLSTAVSLLNPDVVVIGGDIALAHEPFLLGVRETGAGRSQPLATAHLRIAPRGWGTGPASPERRPWSPTRCSVGRPSTRPFSKFARGTTPLNPLGVRCY